MMKSIYIYVMMIALILTACQDDNESIANLVEERQEEEEIVPIQLQLSVNGVTTYAYTQEEDKETYEKGTIDKVELYIFGSNGYFYEYKNLTVSETTYKSDPTQLPKGNWYIYAFIHKPANFIREPVKGVTTIDAFERQVVVVGTRDEYKDWTSILVPLLGTLVRSVTTVYGTGTSSVPETIRLEVGNLLSKVGINQEPEYRFPPVKGTLKGTFKGGAGENQIRYSISHESKTMFLISQWEGNFLQSQPFSSHFYSNNPDTIFYKPLYYYRNITMPWYTVENINQTPAYTNSSNFIVQYIYTPHPEELYDVINHKPGADLKSTGTFWIAEFTDGTKLMYNEDPRESPATPHPEKGIPGKASEYIQGECYYRIPIADHNENIPSRRYAVLRNHYYFLTVKSISFIGSATIDDWDDLEPPLGPEMEIDIEVSVTGWEDYEIPVELD